MGPADGRLQGALGRASTTFGNTGLVAAVAQSIAVYRAPQEARAIVAQIAQDARECATFVADKVTYTVRLTPQTGLGDWAAMVTITSTFGVEEISVIGIRNRVSVLALAARGQGPSAQLVEQATQAAARRLRG